MPAQPPADLTKLREIASAQKWVIWSVLIGIIGNIIWPLMIITIPILLYAVYRIACATGRNRAGAYVPWMLAMFVPFLSTICLLVLNAKATKALTQGGIRVGLFGANSSDFARRSGNVQ